MVSRRWRIHASAPSSVVTESRPTGGAPIPILAGSQGPFALQESVRGCYARIRNLCKQHISEIHTSNALRQKEPAVQMDSKYRIVEMHWVVTVAALAQGTRGATTEIFAPVQGFFQVPTVADLKIDVSAPASPQ